MITQSAVESRAHLDYWWFLAVGSVILAVLVSSLYAPDMVTGSNHEQLPLAGFIDWIWGAVAVGYLSFVRRERTDMTLGISVALLWAAVAITSVAAPVFVTGTDPTSIPIAALVVPIVGTIITGFLALHAATRRG